MRNDKFETKMIRKEGNLHCKGKLRGRGNVCEGFGFTYKSLYSYYNKALILTKEYICILQV